MKVCTEQIIRITSTELYTLKTLFFFIFHEPLQFVIRHAIKIQREELGKKVRASSYALKNLYVLHNKLISCQAAEMRQGLRELCRKLNGSQCSRGKYEVYQTMRYICIPIQGYDFVHFFLSYKQACRNIMNPLFVIVSQRQKKNHFTYINFIMQNSTLYLKTPLNHDNSSFKSANQRPSFECTSNISFSFQFHHSMCIYVFLN